MAGHKHVECVGRGNGRFAGRWGRDCLHTYTLDTVSDCFVGLPAVYFIRRCCICQVEFEDSDPATTLPCRHCYHSECVRQWLQQSKACPVCGKEVE